jgi:hypothetical protein
MANQSQEWKTMQKAQHIFRAICMNFQLRIFLCIFDAFLDSILIKSYKKICQPRLSGTLRALRASRTRTNCMYRYDFDTSIHNFGQPNFDMVHTTMLSRTRNTQTKRFNHKENLWYL